MSNESQESAMIARRRWAVGLLLVAGCSSGEAPVIPPARTADQSSAASDTTGPGAGKVPPAKRKTPTAVPSASNAFLAVRPLRFYYDVAITGLSAGVPAKIWVPLLPNCREQTVVRERVDVPGESRETTDRKHGNRLLYIEATADAKGEIPLRIDYLVERNEVARSTGEPTRAEDREKFLAASKLVPNDGRLAEVLLEKLDPPGAASAAATARRLYDAVARHMKYDKPAGEPWGRGDAVWACDARYGNCSDYHSLFIAACRERSVPAKFEIGFPIAAAAEGDIGGYHCWAKFDDGRRWVAVDISAADNEPATHEYFFGSLTPDRVLVTTGRDLQLEPPPAAGPVNFLVYPYVEVDGQPHEAMRNQFRFESVDSIEAATRG